MDSKLLSQEQIELSGSSGFSKSLETDQKWPPTMAKIIPIEGLSNKEQSAEPVKIAGQTNDH
jgi:hypothetical protein